MSHQRQPKLSRVETPVTEEGRVRGQGQEEEILAPLIDSSAPASSVEKKKICASTGAPEVQDVLISCP